MRKILAILSLFLIMLAQSADAQVRDNLFLGLVSSFYVDFVSSPVQLVDHSRIIDDSIRTPNFDIPYQTRYLSFFSIGIEPRYNLFELGDNFALSVAAPITFGLGQAVPHNEDVLGAQGFGSIQVPPFI